MLFPVGSIAEPTNNTGISAGHNAISVSLLHDTKARLIFQKTNSENKLVTILDCDAYIGKNGIGKTIEGDMKTPSGEFGVLYAFGLKANPGTSLDYLNITNSHYACDEDCEFYNRIIDANTLDHKCKGEHLASHVPQYNYGISLDYNKDCVYPKGSAIFLHCKGRRDYTAGCISVKERDMITILKNIDINTRIIIEK